MVDFNNFGDSLFNGSIFPFSPNSTNNFAGNNTSSFLSPLTSTLNNFPSALGIDSLNNNPLFPRNPSSSVSSDYRLRLKARTANKSVIYGEKSPDNLLSILYETDGLLFPYSPTVSYTQNIDYTQMNPTHSNQDFHLYNRTPSLELAISGQFSVQNQREGAYCLASLHFLRTVSKMRFGEKDKNAGLPPPVLLLDGFGTYMFNKLPVILKNFSIDLPNNVDYIQVIGPDGDAWIPSLFTLSINVVVQQTPTKLRKEFNWDDFRSGKMMGKSKGGWI